MEPLPDGRGSHEMSLGNAPSPAATPGRPNANVPWPAVWGAVVALSAVAATVVLMARHGAGGGLFVPALCFAVVLLAAGFDAATARVPNPLTYTAILAGLFFSGLGAVLAQTAPRLADHWLGAPPPAESLYGLLAFGGGALACRALFPGQLGGGDAKLIAGIGALLGLSPAADALACGLAVAVVFALVNLIVRHRLNATLRAGAVQAMSLIYLRDPTPAALPSGKRVPLAVPILVGLALYRLPFVAAGAEWLRR